jgi:predicted PurR-regulated permease PerM
LGLWVAGIGGVALWGTVMAVLSIIPGVGSALVWIPAVVTLGVQGEWAACLGLLIWCVAVVSSVDNVLRPWLVGKDTELPDLVILLSTLGGLTLFGAIGIVLGPIVAALLITVWDMYGTAFRDVLPPPPTSPPTIPPEDLVKYLQERADESSAPETLR